MSQVRKNMDVVGVPGGSKRIAPTIHSAKKLTCSAAENKVYTCDVEVDVSEPMLNTRQKSTTSLRMVRASDGWKVSQ